MNTLAPFQFGISTLLWITTLAAIVMSVSATVPGGAFDAIVFLPAMLRTWLYLKRNQWNGKRVSIPDRVLVLAVNVAITVVIVAITIGVASLFAWLANSSSMGHYFIGAGFTTGDIVGACLALPLYVCLLCLWFHTTCYERVDKPNPASSRDERSPEIRSENYL
jgi:hypothetical protein